MNYLLDTCVISEFAKPQTTNPGVREWLASQSESMLYLSVITVGEIQKGIAKLKDTTRKSSLNAWLQQLTERFDGRILPLDIEAMVAWGDLVGTERRNGVALPAIDSLIAAVATVHHLTIVSRNVWDFEACHVSVVNPWFE